MNFNPIYFLERLDRCFSPFSFISSDDMFEYFRYVVNNSQILVEERLNQLKNWKKDMFSRKYPISNEFTKWFGYQLNVIVNPRTYHTSSPVNSVSTIDLSVSHVIDILEKIRVC